MDKDKDTAFSAQNSDSDGVNSAEESRSGEGNSQKKNNNHLFNILAAAAVICVLIGGVVWYKTRSGSDAYTGIQEAAAADTEVKQVPEEEVVTEAPAAATTASAAAATTATAAPAEEIPIDFETLWETCPDAYAWIRVPETQIDYPVCQMVEGDQSFYLNHRADKVAEFAGAIYSENYNKRDFTDPVTVLYGHDMNNGSMFQNLHYYEDRAYFDKNKEVIIYLPDKVLHYTIFAAYNYSDEHLLVCHDNFSDPNEFYFFLQNILAQQFISGFVDQNTELTRESRILTLSTCNAYDNQRYLVQCLLTNPEVLEDVSGTDLPSEESQTGR